MPLLVWSGRHNPLLLLLLLLCLLDNVLYIKREDAQWPILYVPFYLRLRGSVLKCGHHINQTMQLKEHKEYVVDCARITHTIEG